MNSITRMPGESDDSLRWRIRLAKYRDVIKLLAKLNISAARPRPPLEMNFIGVKIIKPGFY